MDARAVDPPLRVRQQQGARGHPSVGFLDGGVNALHCGPWRGRSVERRWTGWRQAATRAVFLRMSASGSDDNAEGNAVQKVEKPQRDFGERLFEFFFGKQKEEPMGLKRFGRDRFPEQYTATLDEFADPVDSDDEQMALFRPLLARTQLEKRELKLVFDAERDGWSASAFHNAVNRLGAGVVLCETEAGTVCGGYNPKGWVGYGESRGSLAAFLFTWPDGDTSKKAIKLRKTGGKALSILDDPDSGPKFGADGLVIELMSPYSTRPDGTERRASSKLGTYYEVRADGTRHLFGKTEVGKRVELRSFKVYTGVYADGEEIPYVTNPGRHRFHRLMGNYAAPLPLPHKT